MKHMKKSAIAVSAFTCAALFSFSWSEQGGISLSVESAQARVGRPLTPVSVAGVARRQNRRAAVYGVAGAAAIGAAAVAGTAAAAPYDEGPGYYSGGAYYGAPEYHQGGTYYGTPEYHQGGTYYGTPGYHQGGPYAAYTGYQMQDYATRNGFVCHPGSMVKLDDGQMYRCQ